MLRMAAERLPKALAYFQARLNPDLLQHRLPCCWQDTQHQEAGPEEGQVRVCSLQNMRRHMSVRVTHCDMAGLTRLLSPSVQSDAVSIGKDMQEAIKHLTD